ncbi:hypothetical protein D3C72_1173820 [compost metagenome]
MGVAAREARQTCLALLVLHRHHAPRLKIGGCGRRLCGCDQKFQAALRQSFRQIGAGGAMVQQGVDRVIPERRRKIGLRSVAGLNTLLWDFQFGDRTGEGHRV